MHEFVQFLLPFFSTASGFFKNLPDVLFVRPLRLLYFGGPRVMGWGGWEGISYEDICAQLTLVPASTWYDSLRKAPSGPCVELLERKFQTLLISVSFGFYALVVWKIISYIWFRYFVVGPLLKEFRNQWLLMHPYSQPQLLNDRVSRHRLEKDEPLHEKKYL